LNKKAKLNNQLIGVSSAKEYSNQPKALVAGHKLNSENSFEKDPLEKLVDEEDEEAILSNNPEDWKDTIFSGEGEILATAGETNHHPYDNTLMDAKNLSNKEIIDKLQKENKFLKSQMKMMIKAFWKFKHNTSIGIDKESIKLPVQKS
jgi:hypothetical protein